MRKKLLFIPVLAVGVLGLFLLVRRGSDPELVEERELARSVRVLEVPRLDVLPRVVGFGVVRPERVWQAVPEVAGRIVEMDDRLREGNIFKEGAVLLKIDRSDYDLEVAEAEAQIASLDAEIEQLDARIQTLEASLAIEKEALALAEVERGRVKVLVDKDSLPAANLDEQSRIVLTQSARVQEVENSLTMAGPDRKVLETNRVLQETRLQKARLNVERTTIRAPFDCRMGEVSIERDQVVQKGQAMFSADSIARSEVTAQFPMMGLASVFPIVDAPIDATQGDPEALLKLGLSGTVRLTNGRRSFEWDAEVVRVEGIDSQTRTVGLVVSVEGSYREVRPSEKPPLVRGMYVEVEVRGLPRRGTVVVPRSAMHSGRVHLVDEANRMEVRPIEVGFVQSGFASILAGLDGGERLVLTDLVPAVGGMLLDPEIDEEADASLTADATGQARTR
ncbi:MAG: efflux RND transporter periplasmic adaptor subunit [Planctomycetota bacterium]